MVEVSEQLSVLSNEELRNVYRPLSTVRIIKPRRLRWSGHIERGMYTSSWKTEKEMGGGTGSGSYPLAGYGISSVDTSTSTPIVSASYF